MIPVMKDKICGVKIEEKESISGSRLSTCQHLSALMILLLGSCRHRRDARRPAFAQSQSLTAYLS